MRFRIIDLLVATALLASAIAFRGSPWNICAVVALGVNVYLHRLSEGRTSPVAAFSFVAFVAASILAVGGPYVVAELDAQYAHGRPVRDAITRDDVSTFYRFVFCLSLMGSACVTAVVAYFKRDIWFNHL